MARHAAQARRRPRGRGAVVFVVLLLVGLLGWRGWVAWSTDQPFVPLAAVWCSDSPDGHA